MTEKIVKFSANDKGLLPFQYEWKNELVTLSGGQIQTTFLHPKEEILHVSLSTTEELNEWEKIVCNRWIDPKKGLLIASQQNLLGDNCVSVPRVRVIGEVQTPGRLSFSYWLEEEVRGEPLDKLALEGKPSFGIYEQLVLWIASFHSPTLPNVELRSYFLKRLESIEKIMENDEPLRMCLGNKRTEAIFRLIRLARNNVSTAVDQYEVVDNVHGDLRGNNILVDKEAVSVFDFEQGINGGDWYYDLEKLLLIEKQEQPDRNKPYLYLPNINMIQKYMLVRTYTETRVKKGWRVPTVMDEYLRSHDPDKLSRRRELYEIENALSILILRYLMGWGYSVNQDGLNQRGVNFIADLLLQNYNGYISQ